MGRELGPGVCPKRSRIVELYTNLPEGSAVVCVHELGSITPHFFPLAPTWLPDGHRSKAPLDYSRGRDKAWVFGALRIKDGESLSFTSRQRNSRCYLKLLTKIERSIPDAIISLIADNLRTHKSALVNEWLEEHPRIEHAFIPKGAAWLNPIEVWWRLFRWQALAGQDFADNYEIDQATKVATRTAKPKSQTVSAGPT